MKDYEYIKNHPEEYVEQYKAADAEVREQLGPAASELPENVLNRSIETTFHINLIKNKEESVPVCCEKCPMLMKEPALCAINSEWIHDETSRPDWCPLRRYEVEDEHENSEQDLH